MNGRAWTSADACVHGNDSWFYRGWLRVGLGFLLMLFSAGPIFYSYSVLSEQFRVSLSASRTAIGLGYSAVLVLGGVYCFAFGWLAQRWHPRLLGAAGCLLLAAGIALMGCATKMWHMFVLLSTIVPVGEVLVGGLACNCIVAGWFERRRGRAIGLAMLGSSVATVVFPPLAGALSGHLGWRATYWSYAAMLGALAPLVLAWGGPPAGGIPVIEAAGSKAEPARATSAATLSVREILVDCDFWAVSIPVGMITGITGGVMLAIIPFASSHHVAASRAAFLISVLGGAATAMKLGFCVVADSINLRWFLRGTVGAAAVCFVLLSQSADYRVWMAASLLYGLSLGAMYVVWGALLVQIFGLVNYASVMGWSRTVQTPLLFACPLVFGVVYDRTGSYPSVWSAYLLLTVVAIGASFLPLIASARRGRLAAGQR